MARVSFIMDKPMRKFGLDGKSVIPLIGGVACAVPAIMATRTIQNWKERIITIMVTPLMSCSARIPVYTLLISMVVPNAYIWGFINLQGIVLMALYLVGFLAAIASALAMKYLIKAREKGFFIMEMPVYRMPRWSNIGLTILEKVKLFLFQAGKIIIAISIVLWMLSSFGPGDAFKNIDEKYSAPKWKKTLAASELHTKIQSEKLSASYAGILGKAIEPAIRPLGFDWKIGIALVTSFAAREVFVGTMATIYSVGEDSKNQRNVRQKMAAAINPDTGKPLYTIAVGFSLMLFYAFAMQCMSTVAVVFRETGSWKWPLLQIVYMSALAYFSSMLVYQLFK
jgi:ferrous iron transport protein B